MDMAADKVKEQPREMTAEEVLQKFDQESNKRDVGGVWGYIIAAICILFAIFQLYTSIFGVLDATKQRAIHLCFGFMLVFLLYPMRKSWSKHSMHPVDVVFAALGAIVTLYIIVEFDDLVLRAGMNNDTDVAIGILGMILLFEAARRAVGLPMITVAALFIVYAFAGPYMPGILAHRGVGVDELVSHLYFTTEGVFGTPMGVSSTFIYLFILFGAYLESTGLGKFFIDIANAIAGWAAGGPAKVAVLSSGLMGTVSGSSVANVAGTGSFTIPMMKKLGYKPEFAGAVEAAASTGGQLMPPVMGAAAFLMAEFVGVSYVTVVKAAVIPAILYYTGVWLGVHYEAKKNGLKGTPREELPKFMDLLTQKGHLAIPLIIIVYLLVSGYTPMRAALYAIGLTLVCACLRKSTRLQGRAGRADCLRDRRYHHRRCHQDGRRPEAGDRAAGFGGRAAVAGHVLHHDYLADFGHGRTDDGKLRYYFDHRRPGAGADACTRAGSAHVRVLLRHCGGRHAACGAGRLRGCRYCGGEPHEMRCECGEAGHCGLYRTVHLRPGTAAADD